MVENHIVNVVNVHISPTNNPHILRTIDAMFEDKKVSNPSNTNELVENWEASMFEANRVLS
jgi:hypothetical protein